MEEKALFYLKVLQNMPTVGHKLLKILGGREPVEGKNIIVFVLLRKTVGLIEAMGCLIENGFTEEAQILARVLFETKVSIDYFMVEAKVRYEEVTQRFIDCLMLDKIKQLEAVDYRICPNEETKKLYFRIKGEIERRYDEAILEKLKRYGFTCLSMEQRAQATNNKELYNLVYRFYSRNIHVTDANEQLMRFLQPTENNVEYDESRFKMILEASYICGVSVLEGTNEWLGKPVDLSEFGIAVSSGESIGEEK